MVAPWAVKVEKGTGGKGGPAGLENAAATASTAEKVGKGPQVRQASKKRKRFVSLRLTRMCVFAEKSARVCVWVCLGGGENYRLTSGR